MSFIKAIDHIQLAIPEGGEEAGRGFYAGVLGMMEVPKPPHLAVRGGCWFETGSVCVHLGVEKEFRPARKAHPAFLVDDLSLVIDTLRTNGFEAHEDQPLEGYHRIYTHDPAGNRIELMQKL